MEISARCLLECVLGFTVDNNPNDALMIICPPPETQQAAFAAKMRLLLSQGLSPQLFLTAAGLQAADRKRCALPLNPFVLFGDVNRFPHSPPLHGLINSIRSHKISLLPFRTEGLPAYVFSSLL